MSGLDPNALDRYITDGRYSKSVGEVTCNACGETTTVTAETEYGATTWEPEECGRCGNEFTDEEMVEAEDPRMEYDPSVDDFEM